MATTFSKSPYAHTSYSGADMMATITIKHTDGHKNATCVLGELQTFSYSTHMERAAVRKLGNVNASDFTNGPRTIAGSLVFAVFNRHMIRPILEQMQVQGELLPDELPPFDITITYANEYGHNSVMRVYGIRLVNEGQVCSINDVYTENTYQYVAQNIEILKIGDLSALNHKDNTTSVDNSNTHTVASATETELGDLIEEQDLVSQEIEKTIRSELVLNIVDGNQIIFDAIPRQAYLELKIDGKEHHTYALAEEDWPYVAVLSTGNYVATLQNKKGEVFNSLPFSVQAKTPKAPRIVNRTAYVISGEVLENDIAEVIYFDDYGFERSVKLYQNKFKITDLKPNTAYYLYCKSIYNLKGSIVDTRTLKEENESDLYQAFLDFIQSNALSDAEFEAFIEEAKKSDKPLLEACYDIYEEQFKTRTTKYPETYMHLVAYFDLAIKQKNYDFICKNKWLCYIEKHSDASNFKVYSPSGISSDIKDHTGIIKLQQFYYSHLQKLNTYKPSALLQQTLQKQYLEKQSLNETLKESFNVRYGLMPIQPETGYFDAMLNSSGAYISIKGRELIAHHNHSKVYFVFKEDLNLDIAFKIKAKQYAIDFTTLDFYDSRNTYTVYLECDQKPISKSILIKRGEACYSYDALLSLALRYKMQDFIKELILEKNDLFKTFCEGFYLLTNRKKLTMDYIRLFDTLFYSSAKGPRLKYIMQDGYLFFDQDVYYVLFDRQGNFIESGYGYKIKKHLTGYMIWSTPHHQADCLNFENL